MRNASIESFEELELSALEEANVEGGGIWKYIEKGLTYVGIYDAITDFHKGMNEGCGCP